MNDSRASRNRGFTILYLLVTIASVALPSSPATSAEPKPAVVHQLRIYEIFDNNKQAFHDRFRNHALRIMSKYDFKIVSIWEAKNGARTEFVYLLEWPDKETMQDRWAKFIADQEWSAIKKETGALHGRMVGEIQDRTLELTGYSPNRKLLGS